MLSVRLKHPSSLPISQCITRAIRGYAVSVKPPKVLPGKHMPRVFHDKKAFQHNWYTRILSANTTSPVIILHHNEFSADRLIKLRRDILTAFKKASPALTAPTPIPTVQPTLTVIRSSIFGAALRDLPGINIGEVERLFEGLSGGFAILSLPSLHPPQLDAIIRALDRGVPPRKPKTKEEIEKELEEKNADPATPGRRVKRMRPILRPELKLVGALIEDRVLIPASVRDVSKYPTLETLRSQIVGLLSSPATQLAAVLSEASGGRLARTLEGFRKGMEEPSQPEPPTL